MPYKDPEIRKQKAREQSRAWYSNNLEYAKARRRAYNKSEAGKIANRNFKKTERGRLIRRAKGARRKASIGSHTARDLFLIFNEQRGLCFYCGNTVTLENSHSDHFIPLAMDGTNYRFNIVISCAPCNNDKKATHPGLFMKELGRFPSFWYEQFKLELPSNPKCFAVQAVWHLQSDHNLVLDTRNR